MSCAIVGLFEGRQHLQRRLGRLEEDVDALFETSDANFCHVDVFSIERETTLTVEHIRHWCDTFPSNHSTTIENVSLALKRHGNPRDSFLKTGNDGGRRVLLQRVRHFFTSEFI